MRTKANNATMMVAPNTVQTPTQGRVGGVSNVRNNRSFTLVFDNKTGVSAGDGAKRFIVGSDTGIVQDHVGGTFAVATSGSRAPSVIQALLGRGAAYIGKIKAKASTSTDQFDNKITVATGDLSADSSGEIDLSEYISEHNENDKIVTAPFQPGQGFILDFQSGIYFDVDEGEILSITFYPTAIGNRN